jgi:hypothetical protein
MANESASSTQDEQENGGVAQRDEYAARVGESGTESITFPEYIADSASTDRETTENQLNAARLREYRKELTRSLLSMIAESDLEYGFSSELDAFLRDRLSENALAIKEWLNWLFVKHFADVPVATGILRTIAHLGYHEISPQGPTMALASLSHRNAEVRECGIRAFENWGTLDSLTILKAVKCPEQWMQDYVNRVVADLEDELR